MDDHGNVSTEAYFALELTNVSFTVDDFAISNAMASGSFGNFTVETWVQPYLDTSLDPDVERIVFNKFGWYSVGFTGDGRLYGTLTAAYNGHEEFPTLLKIVSPQPLSMDQWLYVSFTVSPTGGLALYEGETLLAKRDPPQNTSWKPKTNVGYVEFGGDHFSGRLRNVIISNRCKQSTSNPQNPKADIKDFSDSIYYAATHSLPKDAIASFNLMHPTGEPEKPTSAVPLCCLHVPPPNNPGPTTMTTIDLPHQNGIELQSLTAARYFAMDGYVSCGFGAFRAETQYFTLETWVMLGHGPDGITRAQSGQKKFTIASCGTIAPRVGLPMGWCISVTSDDGDSNSDKTYSLEVKNYVRSHRDWISRVYSLETDAVGQWIHVAVNSTSEGTAVFVNGVEKSFLHPPSAGEVYAKTTPFAAGEIHSHPLVIGAALIEFQPGTVSPLTENLAVQDGWVGYIKLVRIWKTPRTASDILKIYDLDYEPDDMTVLSLYADLDAFSPADLTLNVLMYCSIQTEYEDCVVTKVTDHGSSTGGHTVHAMVLNKRLLRTIGRESRLVNDAAMNMTIRAFADSDTPFLAGFLGEDNVWFNVIDLIANIFFVVMNILTKASVNKKAMANVLHTLFGKFGVQMAKYIKVVVDTYNKGLGIMATLTSTLDVFYFLGSSGFFKGLLGCFQISWFAILRLVGRFIPYVGTAALIADFAHGVYDIYRIIQRFLKRSPAHASPLTLLLEPNPLPERYTIAESQSMTFKAKLDHEPLNSQTYTAELRSVPLGALDISPASLKLDKSNWSQGIPINVRCLQSRAVGEASVRTGDNFDLIEYSIVPKATLFIVPQTISAVVVQKNGTKLWKLIFTTVWQGPMNEDPKYLYDFMNTAGKTARKEKVKVETTEKKDDILPGERRSAKRIRKLLAEVESDEPLVVVKVSTDTGLSQTGQIEEHEPKDEANIYMINAGSGDGFYLHFKRSDPKLQSDGNVTYEVHEATMIIDGGNSAEKGQLMWKEVAKEHLPKGPPPTTDNNRGPIDLVIITHQDNDHIVGIQWMYEEMQAKRGLGAGTNTENTFPRMTWLHPPYTPPAPKPKPQRTQPLSLMMKNVQLEAAPGKPKNPIKVPHPMSSPKNESDEPIRVITAPVPIPNKVTATKEAASVNDIIYGQKWESYKPSNALLTSFPVGPNEFKEAGVNVTMRGPTASQVIAASTNPGSGTINRASIVTEISGIYAKHKWTSLWVGDAYTDGLIDALFLVPGSKKHYTILKVGHHGSKKSNKRGFFAQVTADHYLISGDGGSSNPTEETIQNILDGHHSMRLTDPTRSPPQIWISNPLDRAFSFDFKGGIVWERNAGASYPRHTPEGSLFFHIENGTVKGPDSIVAPISDTTQYRKVTRCINRKGNSKRAQALYELEDPALLDPSWSQLLPNDRSKLLPEELSDLDKVDQTIARYRGLICSLSQGSNANPNPAECNVFFESNYSALASTSDPIEPIRYLRAFLPKTAPRLKPSAFVFITFSATELSNDHDVPPYPNLVTPWSWTLQPGQYITGLDVYGDRHIVGFEVYTNWSTDRVGTTFQEGIPRAELRPPNDSYMLVGLRQYYVLGNAWLPQMGYGQPRFVTRLGAIWKRR